MSAAGVVTPPSIKTSPFTSSVAEWNARGSIAFLEPFESIVAPVQAKLPGLATLIDATHVGPIQDVWLFPDARRAPDESKT